MGRYTPPLWHFQLAVTTAAAVALFYEWGIAILIAQSWGNTITLYSFSLGAFLAGMGLGGALSRGISISWGWVPLFVVELLLAFFGSLSPWMVWLFLLKFGDQGYLVALGFLAFLGVGVGLEIPLFLAVGGELFPSGGTGFGETLAFDFFGAVIATMAFPFLLVPLVSLEKIALLSGALNLGIAWWVSRLGEAGGGRRLALGGCALILLGLMFLWGGGKTVDGALAVFFRPAQEFQAPEAHPSEPDGVAWLGAPFFDGGAILGRIYRLFPLFSFSDRIVQQRGGRGRWWLGVIFVDSPQWRSPRLPVGMSLDEFLNLHWPRGGQVGNEIFVPVPPGIRFFGGAGHGVMIPDRG